MTNDDVALSMAAHGFCTVVAGGTPKLIYSNVLWGMFVRAIPEIYGIPGYPAATVLVLAVCAWAILYSLLRLGNSPVNSIAALLLIMTYPLLFPQFTINAGLLALSAILLLTVYSRTGSTHDLVGACLLFFTSFLIRGGMFILTIAVGLPLFPWKKLLRKKALAVFLCTALAISGAISLDMSAYSGPERETLAKFNKVRVPITDFGAKIRLPKRPDILKRHGYTVNDIRLIGAWFFSDPKLIDPNRLQPMLDELGSVFSTPESLENGWRGLLALLDSSIISLSIAGFLLASLFPDRKNLLCWLLVLTTLFSIGFLGKLDVIRVYIPVLSLLVVTPLLDVTGTPDWKRRLCTVILVAACIVNGRQILPLSRQTSMSAAAARESLNDLLDDPEDPVVGWGESFRYETIYPVLWPIEKTIPQTIQALGWSALVPYSVNFLMTASGKGFIERLRSAEGVPVMAKKQDIALLQKYCEEHFGEKLTEVSIRPYGMIVLRVLRSEPVNRSDLPE